MLPPNIRTDLIQCLVNREMSKIQQNMYNNGSLSNLLRDGFKGYASFTDKQLVATLKVFSEENHSAARQMMEVVMNYAILGDIGGD